MIQTSVHFPSIGHEDGCVSMYVLLDDQGQHAQLLYMIISLFVHNGPLHSSYLSSPMVPNRLFSHRSHIIPIYHR